MKRIGILCLPCLPWAIIFPFFRLRLRRARYFVVIQMSSEFQTLAALAVVALAAIGLVRHAFKKRKQSGCGGGECGAISPEVKKLQARLKSR